MAKRVNSDVIKSELAEVTVQFHHFEGTTVTVAAAFDKDGYFLGTATSACIDPLAYSSVIGEAVAKTNVMRVAEDKLWEIHGRQLWDEMHKN